MEIQLFFSILMVQSIDKFLIGSHCLSIWNNMTKKQQTQHGAIEKVCHLHNKFFYPIHLYHALSILLYHIPCVIHKKYQTMEWVKRRFSVYMATSRYMASRYIKGVKKSHL